MKLYNKVKNIFLDFHMHYFKDQISFPVCEYRALTFVSFLHKQGYAGSTIMTFLSGLGHFHRLHGHTPPLLYYSVNKIVSALVKSNPKDSRLPITSPILHEMLNVLNLLPISTYDKILYSAVLLLAFHACLRISEFSVVGKDNPHVLKLSNILMSDAYIVINFVSFKHANQSARVVIKKELSSSQYCPVDILKQYLAVRPKAGAFLFVRKGGIPLSRQDFNVMFKTLLEKAGIPHKNFSSHSLRIGGATNALLKGYSVSQIQHLGRWRSNAFMRYLRPFQVLAS